MKEIRINKKNVSHIEIEDFRDTKCHWQEHIPEKRYLFGLLLWIEERKEGWREDLWGYHEVTKNYTVKDGKLYYNPYLAVFSGGKKIFGKHYKTVEEIKQICDTEFKDVNLILK